MRSWNKATEWLRPALQLISILLLLFLGLHDTFFLYRLVCRRHYGFRLPIPECFQASIQACVLAAGYLTNRWTEFHQTLVHDVQLRVKPANFSRAIPHQADLTFKSILFTARSTQCQRGIAIVSHPSVCDVDVQQAYSKLITQIISFGSLLLRATTSSIQSKGNTPKIRVEYGVGSLFSAENLQYL